MKAPASSPLRDVSGGRGVLVRRFWQSEVDLSPGEKLSAWAPLHTSRGGVRAEAKLCQKDSSPEQGALTFTSGHPALKLQRPQLPSCEIKLWFETHRNNLEQRTNFLNSSILPSLKDLVENIHMSITRPPRYPRICLQPWYYSLSAWQVFAAIIVWALILILRPTEKTIRPVKVERSDQLWLTSKRRYSFCFWDSRPRMTPTVACVRTPTWTLISRAGNDHKSWNCMWLRPSKENSGAACHRKHTRRVQLIQLSEEK